MRRQGSSKPAGLTCPVDGNPLLNEGGLLVCRACGRVWGPEVVGIRSGLNVGALDSKSKRVINMVANALEVPEAVRRAGEELMSLYLSKIGGRASLTLAAACLVAAGRRLGYPIPTTEALECLRSLMVRGVRPAKIMRSLEAVQALIGVLGDADPGFYVNSILRLLCRSGIDLGERVEHVRFLAMNLLREAEERNRYLLVGRNPRHLAAVAVLLALERAGVPLRVKDGAQIPFKALLRTLGLGKSRWKETARLLDPGRYGSYGSGEVGRTEVARPPDGLKEAGQSQPDPRSEAQDWCEGDGQLEVPTPDTKPVYEQRGKHR